MGLFQCPQNWRSFFVNEDKNLARNLNFLLDVTILGTARGKIGFTPK